MTDLQRLLLAFPDLKTDEGPVAERLRSLGASEAAFARWRDLVRERIEPEEDEGAGDEHEDEDEDEDEDEQ